MPEHRPARSGVPNKVPSKLQPFAWGDVTLLPGPLKQAFDTNVHYLHSLSPDRYLWTFRKTAGLPTPTEPYGCWEDPKCELRGHSVGHYLSACARVIAQTGDAELRKNADYTVAELAKCQTANGNGYLSAFPEEFFDRVDRFERIWAPYYTIHKILLGLWGMHVYAGNAQALDMLKGMADYFKSRCDKLHDAAMQQMLRCEFGGMHEALLNLYATTRERKYLALAQRFVKRAFIDPLAEGKDLLSGLHANTHIPQVAGQARAYELTGDANRLEKWIKPVPGKPLAFRTVGQPVDITFIPIHQVVGESYGLYWRFATAGSPGFQLYERAVAAFRRRQQRTVDSVTVGDADSESSHGAEAAAATTGVHPAGRWRQAGEDGFFSYRLKVDGQRANTLAVTYWGGDGGDGVFDILIDGTRIATQTLNRNASNRLFLAEYPILRELTARRESIIVRFQPAPNGKLAGGVFGLSVLREEVRR
jgi:hypothetical protein